MLPSNFNAFAADEEANHGLRKILETMHPPPHKSFLEILYQQVLMGMLAFELARPICMVIEDDNSTVNFVTTFNPQTNT